MALSLSLGLSAPAILAAHPLSSAASFAIHKIHFGISLSSRRRNHSVQRVTNNHSPIDSTMIDQEEVKQLEVVRPLGNFPPSIWGDNFANFTLDNELWEKYSVEVAELKEQVRSMLIYEERKASEKIILIDKLERLGVAYHFEDDIEEILQRLFDNYDYNEHYDLYNVSLHFRIFRHGYNMSSDIFRKYKGSEGKLKESLENDVIGMLSLYEAANLAKHGDDILDEALVFTKTRLQTMLPNLSSHVAEQVKRSLNLCLHRSMPRVEARNYIETYGSDPLRNETLLYFAKIDYKLVQMLHLQELSSITKWWNDVAPKLPHVRDRITECFFLSLGVFFEPHYTVARITYAKINGLLFLFDDTYDSYGTLDELKLFTDAVEMWDDKAIKLLPDYLKIIYNTLMDLFKEFDHQFMPLGRSKGLSCLKQETKNLLRSYYMEAKWWFKAEPMPSFEDYCANGAVTCTFFVSIPAMFLAMTEATTNEEVFDWLQNKPKVVLDTITIWRLLDDISTYEVEKARGQTMTGIDLYMDQYGVSKEDAIKEFTYRIEKAWKDLNEACLKPTPISKHLMAKLINTVRLVEVIYRKGDGFTHPGLYLKDLIISVLMNPMPLT